MSALYVMRYLGQAATGAGALYVGKGIIAGVDIAGIKYDGTYEGVGERLKAKATMFVPAGATLVTGQQVPQATQIPITADWPTNFTEGPQQIMVQGRPVTVSFEKIRDIP